VNYLPGAIAWAEKKDKTVKNGFANFFLPQITGLKPGVNEMLKSCKTSCV
jgi:hypothetical protein